MKIPCILCDVIVIRKNRGAKTKTSESTDGRFDSVRRMEADRMSQTALRIREMLNNAYQAERPKSTMESECRGRTIALLLTAFIYHVSVTMLNYFWRRQVRPLVLQYKMNA